VEDGYCDAYMIGRAAMQNPSCFSDKEPDGKEGRFGLLDEYIELSEKYLNGINVKDLKLKAMNFLSGIPGACAYRNKIAKAKTVEEIMALRD
jgi:tRNA-dihydrouridine synthase